MYIMYDIKGIYVMYVVNVMHGLYAWCKWYDVVWCGMCLYVGKWIWMERWMDGRMDRCNVTMHACMHAACKEVGR